MSDGPSERARCCPARCCPARRAVRVALVGVGALAGLLFWARLKVVTDTPRMVYAVPGGEMGADGAGGDGGAVGGEVDDHEPHDGEAR